jgi:hypothetical protein
MITIGNDGNVLDYLEYPSVILSPIPGYRELVSEFPFFIKEMAASGETNKISFDRKISQKAKLYVTGKVHATQSIFSDIMLNIPLTPVNMSVSNGKGALIDISSAFFDSIGDSISARILVTSVDLSPDGISAFNIVLQTKNILPNDMYYSTLNIYCNE